MEKLVQEAAQYLQQGAQPEQIVQSLMEQGGLSQEEATQVVQAAMQMLEGGQGQEGQAQGEGQQSVLAAVADQDPQMLLAILQEFMSLPPEGQQEIMAALEQGAQGGQQQEAAPAEQQGSGAF